MNTQYTPSETIEAERKELREPTPYAFAMNRRAFVALTGAGLFFTAAGGAAFAQRRRGRGGGADLADRLHIGEDGAISVLTGKVEVGQGARTQLAQAAAEELRVEPDVVRMTMADFPSTPDDGGTYGSRTTPTNVPEIRRAAATARQALRKLAAARWDVELNAVAMEDGAVVHALSGRRLTYGELAQSADLAEVLDGPPDSDAALTAVDEWRTLGKSLSNLNGPAIVTGAHRYPSDHIGEDTLYGKVLRAPAYGARLADLDTAAAEAMDGVRVVREGDFVGCTAPTSYRAKQALEALAEAAEWDTPSETPPDSEALYDHLKNHADRQPADVAAFDGAAHTLRAEYHIAYIQHAPLEPRAATAEWDDDGGLTVWTGSQVPTRVRSQLCEAFGLSEDQVRVVIPDTGGGFGGKHTGECAIEAARLAQDSGRPVSLQWTREEEFTWAYFRPAGVIEAAAALDADGRITAWDFININSGGSAVRSPYRISHKREDSVSSAPPLREGSYRGLAATANNFAREAFMDELAQQAGADPLAFRRAHLDDERMLGVLDAAAERFDWAGRRASASAPRGVGIACGTEKGSFVAACAEVEVDEETGAIRVLHLTHAFECGAIMNPANTRAQVDGGVIMGLGAVMTEAVEFSNGKITNAAFKDYRVPKFQDVPPMEVVLVDRPDLDSVGSGETPIIVVAPAIANAVLHATGEPIRTLPLRPAKGKAG